MNIELIKKYKAEFDHFLNEGKLLIRNNDEDIWINMTEVHWDMNSKTVSIIINDEYSELRKALCEGKTIQIWEVIKQHLSDSSEDIYGWKDFKSFKPDSPFCGKVHNYRIKPEEPKFKVGDFVRQTKELGINVSRIYRIKAHISDILYSVEKNIYDVDAINANKEYFELWDPSHKELCYFTNNKQTNNARLAEFHSLDGKSFKDNTGSWKYCEPFINSKPSWFK